MSKGVYVHRRPTAESVQPWVDAAKRWGPKRTRDELLERGVSAPQAAGLAFYLMDLHHGEEHVTTGTRSVYARLLASLGGPDGSGKPVGATPP